MKKIVFQIMILFLDQSTRSFPLRIRTMNHRIKSTAETEDSILVKKYLKVSPLRVIYVRELCFAQHELFNDFRICFI